MSASHSAPAGPPTARLPSGSTPKWYWPLGESMRSSPDRLPGDWIVSLMVVPSFPPAAHRNLDQPRPLRRPEDRAPTRSGLGQPPQHPPPQHPPPRAGAGAALRPPNATVVSSLTVSSCPAGQAADSDDAFIGRVTSKVSPQLRQRKS